MFMRKWAVNGAIRDRDINWCYYLDPGTQDASKVCLDAVMASQIVLLWGARAFWKVNKAALAAGTADVGGLPGLVVRRTYVLVPTDAF
jgi:hypothetical protein